MIWLTTPTGNAYFRADEVAAVTETKLQGIGGKTVRTQLFLKGSDEPFNILEDAETVLERIQNSRLSAEETV